MRQHLLDTFSKLFSIYGSNSRFEVVYSCNAVLHGDDGQYSIWFGQDYSSPHEPGRASVNLLDVSRHENGYEGFDVVQNIGDVESLKVDFSVSQFEELFFENHKDTNVSVHSLVSHLFIGKMSGPASCAFFYFFNLF